MGWLGWALLLVFTASGGVGGGAVPELHGTSLSGAAVDVPGGLHGRPVVLVIGFSQGSREQVAAWGRRLAPDYGGSQAVLYYEVAELESVPKLLRGWVLKKVKESVPERAQAHFLTVTEKEAEWKAAVGFGAADDAYVVLVDGGGAVRWVTHGAATDAGYGELKGRLAGLVP